MSLETGLFQLLLCCCLGGINDWCLGVSADEDAWIGLEARLFGMVWRLGCLSWSSSWTGR